MGSEFGTCGKREGAFGVEGGSGASQAENEQAVVPGLGIKGRNQICIEVGMLKPRIQVHNGRRQSLEKGNTNWESGDNRKVDLKNFAGHSVMIEDDGWNNRNRPAKVYPLGNMASEPVAQSQPPPMEYEKPVEDYKPVHV